MSTSVFQARLAVALFAASATTLLTAQGTQDAAPVGQPARCGTPNTFQGGSFLDNPDCDFYQTNPSQTYAPTSVQRIPVVVHVIQNSSGTGNLGNALVQSQITVLNEDFRAMSGTAGANGVDSQIEFFLATTDPNGQPTTGIVHYTNNTWFTDAGGYYNSIAWNPQRYLNIYTNNAGGGGVLGYVPAIPQSGNIAGTAADRVVILYSAFGRPGLGGSPYNLGRTCTHEVGHYLGLFHTFDSGCGSSSACYTSGDRICDTNPESQPRYGCPTTATSCGSLDPVRNYMDYTNDSCMTGFSAEQVRRMRCTLVSYRPNLAQPAGPIASATSRSGAGNLNSAFFATAPRLGMQASMNVVTFNTPYSLAMVLGYTGAASQPFNGYTVLIDTLSAPVLQMPLMASATVVSWTYAVPNDPALGGLQIKSQGLMLGQTFALTNAMDLVLGN
ncbi:MAG: zinc metalloprotease [Planctomycetes bacterium]|nr:zinc metalloprotease [Planctomycetota bacterium]MCB9887116.1 zinc metalloprotease [Planctomycetota bacterium]